MDQTDAELVEAVRQGSRAAAGQLAQRHLHGCRAIALAIVGEVSGADDVTQDAFVYAMARIDDCRDPSRFRAWLGQIVRSRARNQVRDRKDDRHVPLEAVIPADSRPSPAQDAERSDLRTRLLAALRVLPEDHREVVLLHDLEGWTHREIADHLELPQGTVRSHLHHARRVLRGLLEELRED
jgi:RNA polymerase sigma-70 factor (ECF subfamily)